MHNKAWVDTQRDAYGGGLQQTCGCGCGTTRSRQKSEADPVVTKPDGDAPEQKWTWLTDFPEKTTAVNEAK